MQNAAEYYRDNEIDLYIETASGKRFYFNRPDFDIQDIAHATSMQCRFTGHTARFYSVAEHNVLVSQLCEYLGMGDPFEGLMHDAQEAYLSDIAAPWKVMLPDYKGIEHKLETALRKWAGIQGEKLASGVKRADWIALFIEAHYLIPSRAAEWIAPDGIKEQAALLAPNWPVLCWWPDKAKEAFLRRYEILRP